MPQANTTLTALDLRSCRFGPAGARLLADGLVQNAGALARLRLDHNELHDRGAEVLAAVLPTPSNRSMSR